MAALVRNCSRILAQNGSVAAPVRNMSGHTADSYKNWKKAFFFAAIPVIVLGHVNAFGMAEHPVRPEFKEYDYMRIRTKAFPWGDGNHSLFHNPHFNALPDGYETEEEHH